MAGVSSGQPQCPANDDSSEESNSDEDSNDDVSNESDDVSDDTDATEAYSDESDTVTEALSAEEYDDVTDGDSDVSADFWSEDGSFADEEVVNVEYSNAVSAEDSDDVSWFDSSDDVSSDVSNSDEDSDEISDGACASACSVDAKCAGFPEALCVRDPCTCRETFVDLSGAEVNCESA